jgi:hypothetical protein
MPTCVDAMLIDKANKGVDGPASWLEGCNMPVGVDVDVDVITVTNRPGDEAVMKG